MQEIIKAIEEASIKIKHLIETGDTGKSQSENSTGDTQLKLDIQSDEIIEEIFSKLSSVKAIVDFDTFHRRVTNNELPSIGGVEVAMINIFASVLSSEKPAKIVYNKIKELFDKNIIYSDLSAKCKKSNKLNGLFIYEVIDKVCFSGVLDGLSDNKDAISLLCFAIEETECLTLSKLSAICPFDNSLYSCCETVTLRNNCYYHCDYMDSDRLKTTLRTNANSEKQILVNS